MKLKQDKFRRTRGGHSRLLEIACAKCDSKIFQYQKDGPGILKRLYTDRIVGAIPATKDLACKKCGEVLGLKIIYKKENRPAFRLFVGSVSKKIVPAQ